jgi:hypothetical protein
MNPQTAELKKRFANFAFLFLTAGIVILVDQITKEVVRFNLIFSKIYRPDIDLTIRPLRSFEKHRRNDWDIPKYVRCPEGLAIC